MVNYYIQNKTSYVVTVLWLDSIGGLAVVAFWRSPHGPLGFGPPRAGYSQKRKRKEKGKRAALIFLPRPVWEPSPPLLDSDDMVTVRSPTSGTSGRLQNRISVPPWLLHSDCVYQVPSVFPCSDCAVAY